MKASLDETFENALEDTLEPVSSCIDQTEQMAFNVVDVVQLRGQWIIDVDDEDLPVGFTFVDESHDAEDLDLLHLPDMAYLLADLADVERIVVAVGFGLLVRHRRVFPGLFAECEHCPSSLYNKYLREGTIVPDVPSIRETVADESELALLDILLDRIEGLFLGNFHLCVRPSGNFDDHVQDPRLLVREEWDIMPWRHNLTVELGIDAMLW